MRGVGDGTEECDPRTRVCPTQGEPYFWNYHKGALVGACTRVQRAFQLTRFPRDHLRDIFDSWNAGVTPAQLPKVRFRKSPTRSHAPTQCRCRVWPAHTVALVSDDRVVGGVNRLCTPHRSHCSSRANGGSMPTCSTR